MGQATAHALKLSGLLHRAQSTDRHVVTERVCGLGDGQCRTTDHRNKSLPRSSFSGSHGFDAAQSLNQQRCDLKPLPAFRMSKAIRNFDYISPVANRDGIDGIRAGQGRAGQGRAGRRY